MAYKKDETNAKRVQSWISFEHNKILERFSKMYKLPISRLVAIAIENEIATKKPFSIDFSFPIDTVENAYANEAGKICKFMKTLRTGITLDFLYVLRHDFGVPERDEFLAGFNECIKNNLLESYDAPLTSKNMNGAILYRIKTNTPKVNKAKRKDASDYEKYLKLKNKFDKTL